MTSWGFLQNEKAFLAVSLTHAVPLCRLAVSSHFGIVQAWCLESSLGQNTPHDPAKQLHFSGLAHACTQLKDG